LIIIFSALKNVAINSEKKNENYLVFIER